MEIIKFIFQGFWYFVGSIIIVALILNGVAEIISSIARFFKK